MALLALRGSVTIDFDIVSEQLTLELARPDRLVCVEPGVWLRMRNFSVDALVAVASSSYYAETTYSDFPQPALLECTSQTEN